MTIANLMKVLPLPASPTYTFDGPWEPIEAQLRTRLPQDYKDLMRLYGYGQYMEFFAINAVVSPTLACRLVPEAFYVQRTFVANTPYPMHPQPGGLLACGGTDDGEQILWLTRGATPDEWPVVVWDHDPVDKEVTHYECDLTDFLAGVITGRILFPGTTDVTEQCWGQQAFKPSPDPWPEEG
jgi:hypothetical protein